MTEPPQRYQRSVRNIRTTLDPRNLTNIGAIGDLTANRQQGQSEITAQVIQRRVREQQEKAAEREARQREKFQKQQQKLQRKLSKREQKYQKDLENQFAELTKAFEKGARTPGMGAPGKLVKKTYTGENTSPAYRAAIKWANRQVKSPSQDWTQLCQSFARQAVGASAYGTTALNAWRNVPEQHRHYTYPPPPGSIAYYANSSMTGAGHAVFVGDNGYVYSNDIKRRGKIDIVKWNVFKSKWGMNYLGWIDATPDGTQLPIPRGGNRYAGSGQQSQPKKKKRKQSDPTKYDSGKQALK